MKPARISGSAVDLPDNSTGSPAATSIALPEGEEGKGGDKQHKLIHHCRCKLLGEKTRALRMDVVQYVLMKMSSIQRQSLYSI
jgi:hypothetical protein